MGEDAALSVVPQLADCAAIVACNGKVAAESKPMMKTKMRVMRFSLYNV